MELVGLWLCFEEKQNSAPLLSCLASEYLSLAYTVFSSVTTVCRKVVRLCL